MFDVILSSNGKIKEKEDYERYRWFFTSSGKLVIGGKNSEQNEEIMRHIRNEDVIMHTSTPGSPFSIIKNPNSKDTEETAIFTACFSHEWKKKKKRTEIHIFKGEQVIKKGGMKEGTFGIMGSINKRNVELKLALTMQKGKLRAVPLTAAKNKMAFIFPGDLDKEGATIKIMSLIKNEYGYPVKKEEIMSAIPSDNIQVKSVKSA